MKTIMILGASILQLPAIEKATEMGLRVVAIDMNPDAIGFKVPEVIKEVVSTNDIPNAIRVAKEYKIDGVMTLATDMPIRTVAAIAKELGLVGITEETAINATDKAAMRKALKKHSVPIPEFHPVNSLQDYKRIVTSFKSPFIVKPSDSSGSRGVSLIKDLEDSKQLEKAYLQAKSQSKSGVVMVEEYMTGPEVSVETLAIDGDVQVLQITDKITTGAPCFVEIGHTQPTRLSKEVAREIERITISANKAIGIDNGPSHTEIIITPDGPKIVELGARMGGDCITTHLVPLSTGINMVEACIDIAIGIKPKIKSTINKGAAIRYFKQYAGIIVRIDGIEAAKSISGVQQVSLVHGIGEEVTDITDSGSRIGFIIADGSDADEAEVTVQNALDKIYITISKK